MVEFFDLNILSPKLSSWTGDLIEDPKSNYKFGSFEIMVKYEVQEITRQTYSILDWLGDIGGL